MASHAHGRRENICPRKENRSDSVFPYIPSSQYQENSFGRVLLDPEPKVESLVKRIALTIA
jgi:hypothetical protein